MFFFFSNNTKCIAVNDAELKESIVTNMQIDYEKIQYSQRFKKEAELSIYYFFHENLTIKIADITNKNQYSQYLISVNVKGVMIQNWLQIESIFTIENLSIYYSKKNNDYYLISNIIGEDYDSYLIYHIDSVKFSFEGIFSLKLPEAAKYYESSTYKRKDQFENNKLALISKDGKPHLTIINAEGKKVLDIEKDKQSNSVHEIPKIDQNTKEKIIRLDNSNSFFNSLKLTKEFDLDKDYKKEKYLIDWGNRKISYLNAEAIEISKFKERMIYFKSDTLIVTDILMNNLPGLLESNYTYYYFIKSEQLNKLFLKKIIYERKLDKNENDECGSFKFQYDIDKINVVLFDNFNNYSSNSEESFQINQFARNFNLDDLVKTLSKKDNIYFKGCAKFPDSKEFYLLLNMVPLSVKTVAKYNDIAFYMQEFANTLNYDPLIKYNTLNTSIYILEKVLEKFPDRMVAYLNLADAYWEFKDERSTAKKYYKMYLQFYKDKNSKKIPSRVLERIK